MRAILLGAATAAIVTAGNSAGCTINVGSDDIASPQTDPGAANPRIRVFYPGEGDQTLQTFTIVGESEVSTIRVWMGENPGPVVSVDQSGMFEVDTSGVSLGWHTLYVVEGVNSIPGDEGVETVAIRFEVIDPTTPQ